MDILIYFKDRRTDHLKYVDDITWSHQNIYVDQLQIWNECSHATDTHVFKREDVAQITILFDKKGE